MTVADTMRVVALIAFTDHRDHALVLAFPADGTAAGEARDAQALHDLTQVAPDPDGWLTYDRRPFVGTVGELRAVAERLGVPGCVTAWLFAATTSVQALAVARALSAPFHGEAGYYAVREFVASGLRVEGLHPDLLAKVRTAAPAFDATITIPFELELDHD